MMSQRTPRSPYASLRSSPSPRHDATRRDGRGLDSDTRRSMIQCLHAIASLIIVQMNRSYVSRRTATWRCLQNSSSTIFLLATC